MQQLMSYMRAAMERYNMVSDGDRVAVGLSGGKDSVALLAALCEMRRFYPAEYAVKAVTIDPCFLGEETDYSRVSELCRRLGAEHIIRRTELYKTVFEDRREKSPCGLCAKMRRGMLHDEAKAAGCNKVALGHHLDDAAETLMMNLLGGHIGCFSPVTYLDRKDITVIRPMIFAPEKCVAAVARSMNLPVIKSACPVDGKTRRIRVKELLSGLECEYDGLRGKMVGALRRAGIDGW